MNAEIVKPFRLSEGNFIVTNDGVLRGPLLKSEHYEDEFYCADFPIRWTVSGVASGRNSTSPRISELITGQVGMVNFIERMSLRAESSSAGREFVRQQIVRAQEALTDMVKNAVSTQEPPAPKPVGDLSNSVLCNMLREVVREELRAVIHEEMPAIVADATNFFDGGELRLAMTLRPMDVVR